jgi:hypothetical protein
MKKFIILIMGDPSAWHTLTPEQAQGAMQAYFAFSQRLRDEGRYLDGDGLAVESKNIRKGSSGLTVSDGPYIESKEVLGGYYLFNAKDWDEALSIAKECPGLEHGGGVELRAIMDYNA